MAEIEMTLVRQPWYRRMNIYPGHAWYRAVDSDPMIAANDRMIVILNTELFPDGKPPSKIHVAVDWEAGDQGPVPLTSGVPVTKPNTPDTW